MYHNKLKGGNPMSQIGNVNVGIPNTLPPIIDIKFIV